MFAGWGSWVARFRWPVLSVALVAVIGAGVWGLGVFGQLTEGGYNDPNSESAQATEAVRKAFGAQGGDLIVIYTPARVAIDDAGLAKAVRAKLAALPKSAVTSSTSYWSTKSPQFAAKDRTSAVAVVTLAGADDGAKLESFRRIDDKFAVPGTKVELAGGYVLSDATASRSTDDLARAEIISLPIVLILLVLLFGSLVAASLPVLVGGAAVLGSLGVLNAITGVHEVNSFAVNVASLLGLGMAIDYGLFMVGRFREEQASGHPPAEAVRRTVATAGRTVVFSATLLMIALAGLLLFPQGFLKSLAYGGLAAVALAALLSLTLLPALLAILGPRVDKLPVRLPSFGRDGSFWGRLAAGVLRRPVVVALPILAGLLVLAAPIGGVRFGEADERTLPAGDPARSAIETLKTDYPQFSGNGMPIVLRGRADSSGFAVTLRQIPGIAQIGPVQRAGDVTVFTATLKSTDPFSTEARDVVDQIRSLPVPDGAELLVGGTTARNVDSLAATAEKLPWMVGLLVGATLLLMFFAFGSILLPIKAVVMSALSLSATFGVLVWIFQDGHGASWLSVTPAPLEAGIVVLMAAVVFGLSTDYEVFLLSRMVEARAHGASTNEAVTVGLARTGRVISAAALLLIVVTGAFALSSVTTMRFVGVGMIVALLLDATVVRMLLVPAVLGLMGNAAWWAPGPLRRLQERAGLAEHAGESSLPVGADAAVAETAVLALPPGPSAASWDREAAGVLMLPPAMVPPALPPGPEAATQIIPRIVDEAEVPDDDIVDAEIIEDDEVAAGSAADVVDDGDQAAVVAEDEPDVTGDPPASAGDQPVAAEDESVAVGDEPAVVVAEVDADVASDDEPAAGVGADEPADAVGVPSSAAETGDGLVDEPDADRGATSDHELEADEPAVGESVEVAEVAAAEVVSEEPDDDPPSFAASREDPTGFSYTPETYLPLPGGVYRSASVSAPDYSAPDDFFFAPSANGTFADSLSLPPQPEAQVPYFGDRPDFESPSAPDLDVTRGFVIPGLDTPSVPEPSPSAPPVETPAIFEAPNRAAARSFTSPDPEISQSVSTPKPDLPEPVLDAPSRFVAPNLETTRRLQVPGYEAVPDAAPPAASAPPAEPLAARPVTPQPTEPLPQRAATPPTLPSQPERAAASFPSVTEPEPQREPTPFPPVAEPLPYQAVTPPVEEAAEPLPRLVRPLPTVAKARVVPPAPSVGAGGSRPSDLGAIFSARRAVGDEAPPRPGHDLARPPAGPPTPAPPPAVPVTPALPQTPPAPRRPADLGDHLRESRPADLGDHLRESRPADLAQYSRGRRTPPERGRRTNAPASPASSVSPASVTDESPRAATKAEPQRRPATLADQLPKPRRKPEDDQPAR